MADEDLTDDAVAAAEEHVRRQGGRYVDLDSGEILEPAEGEPDAVPEFIPF